MKSTVSLSLENYVHCRTSQQNLLDNNTSLATNLNLHKRVTLSHYIVK